MGCFMILLSVPKILNLFNPEILSHPAIAGRDRRKSSAAINIPRVEGQEIDPKGMAILASKRRAEASRRIHAHPGERVSSVTAYNARARWVWATP